MPTWNRLKARILSWWKDFMRVFWWVCLLVCLFVLFLVSLFSEGPTSAFYLFGIKFHTLYVLGVAMLYVLIVIRVVAAQKRGQERQQERLKNAIEHMGNDSDSVRLGGAHELFRLARDTRELRRMVLDILCAHVRRTTRESKYQKDYSAKPSKEIQSLLTLLFVQKHDIFNVFIGLRINLAGSWLNGANLQDAHLEGANLGETQLQGADLRLAQLQGADLDIAHLEGADLGFAHLQGANLRKAQLQGADLVDAHLQGACSEIIFYGGFAERITRLVGCKSDLSKVIFGGGLTREYVDSILKVLSLSDGGARVLREQLKPHIDQPPSHELPTNSGAQTGAYTSEEAEAWIAEYEEATSEIPTPETDDKPCRS